MTKVFKDVTCAGSSRQVCVTPVMVSSQSPSSVYHKHKDISRSACETRQASVRLGDVIIRANSHPPRAGKNGRATSDASMICIRFVSHPVDYSIPGLVILSLPSPRLDLELVIPTDSIMRYVPYFEELLTECNGGDPRVNDLIYRYIQQFIMGNIGALEQDGNSAVKCIEDHLAQLIVASLGAQSTENPNDNLSKSRLRLRVKEYIARNLDDPTLTPQKIADACGISLSYMHKIFNITDTSVCRWILQQRLNLSRQRLTDPAYLGMPISQIAYDTGFNNQAHFSSKFKRQFGMTPKQVRNQARSAP